MGHLGQLGGGRRLIVSEVSRNRPAREPDGWTESTKRQGLQVLYNGREMKFVTRTGEPSEPHAGEAAGKSRRSRGKGCTSLSRLWDTG